MLEANTRIYVRDPEREDNRIPGVVSEVLGQKVMVRFLQPATFKPGVETVVYYHDDTDSFASAPCQMQRMFSKGQYPTGALVVTGETQIAEKRRTVRISINDNSFTARVNDQHEAEVVNISCGGIALMIDTDEYKPNTWVAITLYYEGDEHVSNMQVRGQMKDKSGRFRYGLMADPEDAGMISQLTRITQALQIKMKGDPGKTNVKHESAAATSTSSETVLTKDNPAKQRPQEIPNSVPKGGTKRTHQRNPWPGMAKVYIREEQNLRVLSVDTEDLSRGGISFISANYIYEGTEVLFEKPIEGGFFRVMVQIKNIRVIRGRTHRIGAQFLGAPLEPGKMPEGFSDAANAA